MKPLLLAAGIAIAPVIAFSQSSYLDIMGVIRGDSLVARWRASTRELGARFCEEKPVDRPKINPKFPSLG